MIFFVNAKRVRLAEENAKTWHASMMAARKQEKRYRAMLFNAWTTMAGQTRGLQRQRRLINRLRAKLAPQSDAAAKSVNSAVTPTSGSGDANG